MISVMAHPTTAGVLASFATPRRRDRRRAGRAALLHRPARRPADDAREAARTTSASPSRTSASATSTRSSRGPSCAATSPPPPPVGQWRVKPSSASASGSSKLRSLPLLRGARPLRRARAAPAPARAHRGGAEPTEEEIWRSVELARHEDRPYTLDYVERLFEDFVELHGDRDPRRRPGDRRRPRPLRRPHGRRDRPPEGPRHQGAHAPQLRDGATRRATARRCG